MKPKRKIFIVIAMITVLILPAIVGVVSAYAGSGYEIGWWTIDGGGGISESTAGDYTLQGTIGQPDASDNIDGGGYNLRGGFWVQGVLVIVDFIVNLPLVLR